MLFKCNVTTSLLDSTNHLGGAETSALNSLNTNAVKLGLFCTCALQRDCTVAGCT